LGDAEELVYGELADGVDTDGVFEVLGVALAYALDGGHGGVDEFFQAL
jgi:hypothetical protein